MINSLENFPIEYVLDQLSFNKQTDFKQNMSIITNNHQNNGDDQEAEEEVDDENLKRVSVTLENNQEQNSSTSTLRSILRKQGEKQVVTNTASNVQQTSILINESDNNDERDSDYTGDEDEEQEGGEESNDSNLSIEKESKSNEQHHQHCCSSARQQQKDQFVRTLSSTPSVFPLGIKRTRTETGVIRVTESTTPDHGNDQSQSRTACVTFTDDQPTIIHRSSSTPPFGGFDIEPRPSVTYINVKENLPTVTTTTTTGLITTMTAEFRPVYISPLKYRPLVGLSANDSRLLLEKRVSLLGKPLVFHPIQKRSPNYRRNQLLIYNFLERANGYKALIYHSFVFITVFACLFLSVVVTMPEYEKIATTVLFLSEIIVLIWLSIELGLRVWSAGCRSRYQTFTGRLRFIKKPFCALDFTVVIATVMTLCLNIRGGNGVFAASALRGLRFFQILRMLRMDRRAGTWKLLGSVVYAHRQELITTIYIGFLVLIFSSFVMFIVEKDIVVETDQILINNLTNTITNLIDKDRHKFETFADALWWGIITLCTVGYGDKVPSSYIGKFVAAICSFIGISFFALPAGILGSGFALKVQQQQRQKHYKRRKIPAVLLIQNLWRVYAADEKSLSKATWKVHVRPPRENNGGSLTSQTNHHPMSFKIRNNQSFLNRVSFRRRTPTQVTSTPVPGNINTNSNMKPSSSSTVTVMRSCVDTLSETASITPSASIVSPHEGSSSDNEDDHLYCANDVQSLTSIHRHAIRFTRKVKFFVARRKFREALRPYDVTDVIEQYSTGNVDMLSRMKYLQARLDKVLGTSKSLDSYESGPSLASRICKIEQQVDGLDLKVDQLCQLATNLLDRTIRQSASIPTPSPAAPIVINRIRTGNRLRVYRRRNQLRPRPVLSLSASAIPSVQTSSSYNSLRANLTQPSPSTAEDSRESLFSLYCLFQDNLNSSKTDLV